MARDKGDAADGLRTLRGPMGATILFTTLTLIGLAIGWAWLFHRTSESSAVQDAGRYGELSGRAALAPFLTEGLLKGDKQALANMSIAGQALIDNGGAKHVKVWSRASQVLWADEPQLIGRTFELEPDEKALFDGQGILANISDLSKTENQFEIAAGEKSLLQVYFGSKTDSGVPVLVETYYPTSLVDARAADQRRSFLPLLLGGLGLLTVAQVPLLRAFNQRLKRLQREREELLQRVIATGDTERRRIAAEVHDGAVQELIGITFSLSAVADEAGPPLKERLTGLAGATRHTVRSLRSLLNSIYPVQVPEAGWAAGLDDITDALRQRGVTVTVGVPTTRLSPANELLLLRVGREALRNIDAHARASHVSITMDVSRTTTTLSITDNGVGFDNEMAVSQRQVGHLGLQLLRDLAEEMGAELIVDSTPGSGTTVQLRLEESR